MTSSKKLGIWLDHAIAYLIEFNPDSNESAFTSEEVLEEQEAARDNREQIIPNKEREDTEGYFKNLCEAIKNYNEVLLFGPSDAKTELFNTLRADNQFNTIKLITKQANKMSEDEQHAFVSNYFSKKLVG